MNKSITNKVKVKQWIAFIGFGGFLALIAPCKAFVSDHATRFIDERINQTVGDEIRFSIALLMSHCSEAEVKKAEAITGHSRLSK